MWVAPLRKRAAIAQSVEHIIRNDGVAGSNPVCGTSFSLKINSLQQGSSFEIGRNKYLFLICYQFATKV
jgi:hypothetical protein